MPKLLAPSCKLEIVCGLVIGVGSVSSLAVLRALSLLAVPRALWHDACPWRARVLACSRAPPSLSLPACLSGAVDAWDSQVARLVGSMLGFSFLHTLLTHASYTRFLWHSQDAWLQTTGGLPSLTAARDGTITTTPS
jgi:hypothetical protein